MADYKDKLWCMFVRSLITYYVKISNIIMADCKKNASVLDNITDKIR